MKSGLHKKPQVERAKRGGPIEHKLLKTISSRVLEAEGDEI